jgi:uncharacterized protein DUF6545
VRTVLLLSMFASQALAFVVKFRDLRRNPGSPFLRRLCVALALSAAAALAGVPVVLTFLEISTGIPAIWLLGLIVASSAAMQATLQLWMRPPHQARRGIRIEVAVYGAAIATMIALSCLSRGHVAPSLITENEQAPEALWGVTPYVRDAFLVYFAAMIFGTAEATRIFLGSARLVDRHWLRHGLLTLAAGSAMFLVYLLAMTVYVVALRFDLRLTAVHDGSIVVAAVSTVIIGVGITVPVLGPRWDRLLAYRRLEPLWLALRRAAPDVVLEPPWSTRLDAWSTRNLDFRLYRRVIEIRDGALAVRPYFDPDVAASARKLATLAQLPAAQVETAVEAAQLRLAVRARAAGHPPSVHNWEPPTAASGKDLDAELTALVPLAQAFATSAIVRTAAADACRADRPSPAPAPH